MNRSTPDARPTTPRPLIHSPRALFALLPLVAAWPALAGELTFGDFASGIGPGTRYDLGPVQATVSGAVRLGTELRTDAPHHVDAANAMTTLNDGDLNYGKGDAFSTALETYLQADFRYRDAGVFVSAKAWYDEALKDEKVPHGSVANGYAANSRLSDKGFVPLGRFANVVLDDAYVYDTFHLGQHDLQVRLGNLVVPWVTPTTIGGGIQQVNAVDYAALARASSVAEEAGIPAPSLYAKLEVTPALSVDGFVRFHAATNAYPACGTFFSTSDYAQQGCDKMTLNGAILSALTGKAVSTTDAQSAANPLDYVSRGADIKSTKGEYGLGANLLVDRVGLFGAYFATYGSRSSLTGVVRTGPGVVTPALANLGEAVPTGIAAEYVRIFPKDIHMLGLNFKTKLPDGTGVYSELTYRPDQPLGWNGADFLTGVLSGKGPLARLATTPVGSLARGYDDFKVAQFNLGASRPMGSWGGGDLNLSGETALKYVADLPDPSVMRYGRVGWGVASNTTTAGCTSTAQTCALKGFITSTSWGARAKLADRFTDVGGGFDLEPSVSLAWDVRGYSYDAVFSQGRKTALFDLRGTWRRKWTFDLSFLKTGGGTYNVVDDRSFVSLSAGLKI